MIVYKVTNTVNNKIYIGVTSKSLKERIYNHKQSIGKVLNSFYEDMAKYSFDVFQWETIDETLNGGELQYKEKYWIKHYDSFRNGYNNDEGGNFNITKMETASTLTEKIMITISQELEGELEKQAQKENRSLSNYIVTVLQNHKPST